MPDETAAVGEILETDPDFAQGETLLPVLVDPPPVGVADVIETTEVALDQILVLVEQVQQRYEFPALPKPVAFAIAMNSSAKNSPASAVVMLGCRM